MNLTRGEIAEIAKNVAAEYKDSIVVVQAINHAINDAEKEADKPLDGAEVADLADKIMNDIRQVIERITTGKASVADYNYIGEKRINEKNIEIANAEVSEYRNITAASQYRLNSIEPAMKVILDIQNINEGTLTFNHDTVSVRLGNSDIIRTIETNFRVKEFEDFGEIVERDYSTNSELSLIKQAIQVMKLTKGDKPLTRREIVYSVIKEVKRNLEDAAILLPRMYHRLNDEQTSKNALLTSEEATDYMNAEKDKVKEAAMRVFVGRGTVDDYKIFGCHNVNKDNLIAINNDINEFRTIRKLSDYRLEGVEDAVSLGIAIYNINIKNVSKNAMEYSTVGRDVDYSDEKTRRFKLMEGQIGIERERQDNKFLTRGEIISCIDDVTNKLEDNKILIPLSEYRLAGLEEEVTKGIAVYNINNNEVIADSNNNAKEFADLADYKLFGETRVTLANKKIVNEIESDMPKAKLFLQKAINEIETIEINEYRTLSSVEVEGILERAKEEVNTGSSSAESGSSDEESLL